MRKKYANDPFGPANYSFEYLFAITMAGQPLAWMEGTNLPQEALLLREQVEKYRGFQHDFHQGIILPVGDMPDGRSWTGFQSIREHQGYFNFFSRVSSFAILSCKNLVGSGNGNRMCTSVGTR